MAPTARQPSEPTPVVPPALDATELDPVGTTRDSNEPIPPSDLVDEIELRDGRTVRLRPLVVADEPAYRRFTELVSTEAQYYRFFSPRRRLTDREVDHFIRVDYVGRLALVAEHEGAIVGVARYDRERDPGLAEVAFILLDEFQGYGLAGRMLDLLAVGARQQGIHRFVASVLPDNQKMLKVFSKSGMLRGRHLVDGVIEVTMTLDDATTASPGGPER